MAISKERIAIYRKLRKCGFHSTSSGNLAALHRWRESNKKSNHDVVITHDTIQVFCNKNKEICLTIMSEFVYIDLKENQTFDVENFNLSDYKYKTEKKAIMFNKTEIDLMYDLYNEIMIENRIIPRKTCLTCKHYGHWEEEVEYVYNSPCTVCCRRTPDNWEAKNE